MAQRSVPAPFLTKTYQLVDDPNTDDVISWNENGTSFVGFRKVVPDKWEFANDNFKRGEKQLLSKISRRKTVTSPPADAPAKGKTSGAATPSPTDSGEDLGSTSTSSPESKNPGSVETNQFTDLSEENQKLKRDNEMLSIELAQAKRKCDELRAREEAIMYGGPHAKEMKTVDFRHVPLVMESGK
ncbi:hypothetical protein Golax_025546, partial [Gossypium laxum]|nr:hypothetical protein [Gossypium laxum]